jgi:hypothetical protein
MKEEKSNNVQTQTNGPHYQNKHRILNTLQVDESLDRLEEYAETQPHQKHAIEEAPEKLDSLPAKGQCFRRVAFLGYLERLVSNGATRKERPLAYDFGHKGNDEADQVIQLKHDVNIRPVISKHLQHT